MRSESDLLEANDSAPALPPKEHGLRRWLYVALGLCFVALGTLGAFLPLLPTTPFLLLASYFFVRSSPRLNRWLLRSPILGRYLHDWQRHRGVRPHVKVVALTMIALAVVVSALTLSVHLIIVLVVLAAIGAIVVLRLPTVHEVETQTTKDTKEHENKSEAR